MQLLITFMLFLSFIKFAFNYFLHLIADVLIFCIIFYVFFEITGIDNQRYNDNICNPIGKNLF
jgi:hypothetical protein